MMADAGLDPTEHTLDCGVGIIHKVGLAIAGPWKIRSAPRGAQCAVSSSTWPAMRHTKHLVGARSNARQPFLRVAEFRQSQTHAVQDGQEQPTQLSLAVAGIHVIER